MSKEFLLGVSVYERWPSKKKVVCKKKRHVTNRGRKFKSTTLCLVFSDYLIASIHQLDSGQLDTKLFKAF